MTYVPDNPLPVHLVFVTSGEPGITYVKRDSDAEADITFKLRTKSKIIAISGPSKSGKTVMIKNAIKEAGINSVWISGNDLTNISDFWSSIAGQLGLPVGSESSRQQGSSYGGSVTGEVNAHFVSAGSTVASELTDSQAVTLTSQSDLPSRVRAYLTDNSICLVIDDFHYAPEDMRKELARALKTINDVRVASVMIAVPHHVLDLVEAERELYMRVTRKKVAHWSPTELARIAFQGFEALNINDVKGKITDSIATNSVGSPLLMQELCARVCYQSSIEQHESVVQNIKPPTNWAVFYTSVAESSGQHPLARALISGPTQRRLRNELTLKEHSGSVDNYGAVLLGLHRLAPVTEINEVDLRTAVNEVVEVKLALDKIRRTCRQMHELAENERGQDDPSLEFIETSPRRLVIVDPYLAFFIRWGLATLGLPVLVSMSSK